MLGERRRWSVLRWYDWTSLTLPVWFVLTAQRWSGTWAIAEFIIGLLCGVGAVMQLSEAVIEEERGLVMRKSLRTKVYAWDQIQHFAVKREGFGLRPIVVLHDGGRKALGQHSLPDERAREMVDALNQRLELEHAAR